MYNYIGGNLKEFKNLGMIHGFNIEYPKNNKSDIIKINEIKKSVQIKWGDTQDLSLLIETTKNVDTIYHLAAQSHVGHSLYNPYETVVNDVLSTLNVVEAARKNDVKSLNKKSRKR